MEGALAEGPRLSFIIGYGSAALPTLRRVLEEESREHGFEWLAVSDGVSEAHLEFLRSSDAAFVYSHELPKPVEEALSSSERCRVLVSGSDSYAHLSKGPEGLARRASAMFKLGGEANLRALVHLLLSGLGAEVEVRGPEEVPWHGVYHPRLGTFRSAGEFLEAYPLRDRPLVGILFSRSQWLYGNVEVVDALIDAMESEGLGALPAFTYGFKDQSLGSPSAEDSIREFFFDGGRPLVEAVVNLTFFFLLDRGKWDRRPSRGFELAEGLELLRKLNVPIIQLALSSRRSVEEWAADSQGLDYMSQVYIVIMPEVDGLIEPIFIAGSKAGSDGVRRYEPFREHAKYVARRVRRWVELRRKPPRERRIAIVLINPPCKGLEASVAVGMGLDVPESVARLLWRLKELGYEVGEELPRDGRELIQMVMERKAISEFRWTPVEEIVARGGALAFVDGQRYSEWFEELPEAARAKMEEDWGHPLDVLSGRVSRELVGMVYGGKFVVPGLRFGNVVVIPQPKFGCAGPACDGKVCRILHDPTITPPHQWLAVYRWITREFRADVVIHFGTHGYLEFRPGKGVGLSPSCWPEITIDDAPHLYVYNVANPMEGVIAKRRGYAAIIDHMYPPMAMAEALDEMDSLLAQYAKAKQLGDFERAMACYERILEEARRQNIRISSDSPEEVVEEIHRYVDAVRGTQIESGLHIFGSPPGDPGKLAEYAAAAMAYDSHSLPSIRRALAEYLGLSYEELRSRPMEVNEFGLTNSELLNALHRVAANVLRRLIESGARSSELDGEELEAMVAEELRRALGR